MGVAKGTQETCISYPMFRFMRDVVRTLRSPSVLFWLILFLWPALTLSALLYRGYLGDIRDAENTLLSWPQECALDRPFHGLVQIRCTGLGVFWRNSCVQFLARGDCVLGPCTSKIQLAGKAPATLGKR